jgi:hypothetical protein
MKKKVFTLKSVGNPYEPPQTHEIYESLDLIKEEPVLIFVRKATEADCKSFPKYTETIYKDIKTGEEVGVTWSGPNCSYVEEMDYYTKD